MAEPIALLAHQGPVGDLASDQGREKACLFLDRRSCRIIIPFCTQKCYNTQDKGIDLDV